MDEYKRFKAVIENGLTDQNDIVTPWEREFLADFHTKFNTYKRSTFISPDQEAIFDRIENKLREELGTAYED